MVTLAAAITALAATFGALPAGLDAGDAVKLDHDTTYIGLEAPEEVNVGGKLTLNIYFGADKALGPKVMNFLHIESRSTRCRIVRDLRPPAPVDGVIAQSITIEMPDKSGCEKSQRLEIYTGLYNRKSGRRFEVLSPRARGGRVYAGYLHIVQSDADSDLEVIAPDAMDGEEALSLLRPWYGWLIALAVAFALALLLARLARRRFALPGGPGVAPLGTWPPPSAAEDKRRRRLWLLAVAAILLVPMLLSILAALDFIKDDAYISFRYAKNVILGEGLVFNSGDHLEGITNFLWTVLMIPFEGLGLDMFQVSEIIGTALVAGMLFILARMTVLFVGTDRAHTYLWAGLWLGTSSSLSLWSTSGMEQPLAMFLPLAAAWLLWRGGTEDKPSKGALLSGVIMGLGCLTRPEIHLIGILLGLPLIIEDLIRTKRLSKRTLLFGAGILAITVPGHAWRLLYYDTLIPNTFYVKTGASVMVMKHGLKSLYEMFGFNVTGLLLVLAPLAFIDRRRVVQKLVMLAIALAYMGFIVKVGKDEMRWHRLYLPALPFLLMLAVLGLRNLCAVLAQMWTGRRSYLAIWGLAWGLIIAAAIGNFTFTYRSMSGFNGRGDLSGNYHPDMGKFITRHENPGAVVAFQDMGSTPYYAPDINFLDFIGLVDRTVAHARYGYGLHAFLATEAQKNLPKFNAEMREYFYARNPEWVILTSYVRGNGEQLAMRRARFDKDPVPDVLGPAVGSNSYQFGIYNARFKQAYQHVRTWPRSNTYYLSLFRRRDLWEQIPGEVVLDAVPEAIGGATATFEGGLELLGSEIEATATEKHDFFMTTWWRVPGPMGADLNFFTHVEAGKKRLPYDAVPGDFMYPADRWRAGDIVEHRTLVQLPDGVKAGDYKVMTGVYMRKSGTRLKVIAGAHDPQQRVDLGMVEITPLRPPFDHLIRPTIIDEMRKYPERIMSNGREDTAYGSLDWHPAKAADD